MASTVAPEIEAITIVRYLITIAIYLYWQTEI